MIYVEQQSCISPQHTFGEVDLSQVVASADNRLEAIEPEYQGIPPGILRRMGKAVRMGVGAALPLIQGQQQPDGIIIGTANGGMEDCIRFLNQIIEYEEGRLTPTNFVQSTPNAIAGQLGLLSKNKGYNITHSHRGLAFENALLDAMLQIGEYPSARFLLGSVDEISAYNYKIEYLGSWYKKAKVSNSHLYAEHSPGSLAGEGAAMFMVTANRKNASFAIDDVCFFETEDPAVVLSKINQFLAGTKVDLLMSGENGDSRLHDFYSRVHQALDLPTIRFKHLTGEFPTAASLGLWYAGRILQTHEIPSHMKLVDEQMSTDSILIYNTYKGRQHSFIRCSAV